MMHVKYLCAMDKFNFMGEQIFTYKSKDENDTQKQNEEKFDCVKSLYKYVQNSFFE